eukprot:jgi/Chlat1/9227/Chrsp99S08504
MWLSSEGRRMLAATAAQAQLDTLAAKVAGAHGPRPSVASISGGEPACLPGRQAHKQMLSSSPCWNAPLHAGAGWMPSRKLLCAEQPRGLKS